jgi:hypothetical protein
MTVYHISKIVGQAPLPLNFETEDGAHAVDSVERLTNRKRRTPQIRGYHGRWAKIKKTKKTTKTPANKGEENQNFPGSHEESFVPGTKNLSCHGGKNLRATTAKTFVGGTKEVAVVDGKKLPARHEKSFVGGTKETAVLGETQIGDQSLSRLGEGKTPPDLAFETWLKTLDRMLPSHWKELLAKFQAQKAGVISQEARAALKRKILAVEEKIYGPAVSDQPATAAPAPAPIISKIAQRQPTAEEIEEGKKFLAEHKKRKPVWNGEIVR